MNVENDRKHCALQISREYFGACMPRYGASQQADKELADSFESFYFEFARTIYEFRV